MIAVHGYFCKAHMKQLNSSRNPLIKKLRRLSLARRRESSIIIEGRKLVYAALQADIKIETLVVTSSFNSKGLLQPHHSSLCVKIPDNLFHTISTLESPDGILAMANRPYEPELLTADILTVAVGVQDPGNLGAIARVTEAAGASGLVVLKGGTDPYSAKALRGSMGSLLRIPVHELKDLDELKSFKRVALVTREGVNYKEYDWSTPVAIIFGSEGRGLDDDTLDKCDARLSIPVQGEVDSLNVATAAALVLYEATDKA